MASFKLISKEEHDVGNLKINLESYEHSSNLRVHYIPLSNPLVSAYIVVPTLSCSHAGQAHTLEHLIFCGSSHYKRGFLDLLATRCMSTGTNAYTSEDHTAYTLTTASGSGMCHALGVFLDHVLNPSLTDDAKRTEVCDDVGSAGVVLNEMGAREMSEVDLMDLAVRQILYGEYDGSNDQVLKSLGYECGGRTDFIKKLTLEEIRAFHAHYYKPENISIVLCGDSIDIQKVLSSLEPGLEFYNKVPRAFSANDTLMKQSPEYFILGKPEYDKEVKFHKKIVNFPSDEEDSFGTLAFSFPGPELDNVEELLQIDIMLKYLTDNSASLLLQTFVENEDNLATEVDYELKAFVKTAVVLVISGIDLKPQDDDSEADSKESSTSEENYQDTIDEYHEILMDTLKKLKKNGVDMKEMKLTILNYKRSILESLEEDPLGTTYGLVLPEILNRFYCKKAKGQLGRRLQIVNLLKTLEDKPAQFWNSILDKWLLKNLKGVVLTVPVKKEATEMTVEKDSKFDSSVAKNKIDLAADDYSVFPGVKDLQWQRESKTNFSIYSTNLDFALFQLVSVPSSFFQIQICIPIDPKISNDLRKYLVLYQESIFQSNLSVSPDEMDYLKKHLDAVLGPKSEGLKQENDKCLLDYKALVKLLISDLSHYEIGVGSGNDTFSCSWLSDFLIVRCDFESFMKSKDLRYPLPHGHKVISDNTYLYEIALSWLLRGIMESNFSTDRIKVTLNNLNVSLAELRRDGSSMVSCLFNKEVHDANAFSSEAIDNEFLIGPFYQRDFIKDLSELENLDGVVTSLNGIHASLMKSIKGSIIQIGVPNVVGCNNEIAKEFVESTERLWNHFKPDFSTGMKRNRDDSAVVEIKNETVLPIIRRGFEFKEGYSDEIKELKISGITSSYLIQMVRCDILSPEPGTHNKDFLPVLLLIQILSASEGPIYSAVRGRGLAYDAHLSAYLFNQHLVFEVGDSKDPHEALKQFHLLLQEIKEKGLGKFSSFDQQMMNACMGIVYRSVSSRSSVTGILNQSFKAALGGFQSLKEFEGCDRIFDVTVEDLERVFHSYFEAFLDSKKRITVLVSPEE
ncbi:hypothetical protein MP638_007322 [Amoeboaphelidium occidentale]|nr:hypothetical protein MP638_007322 [Amoeboaphelidium occidentale]